MMKISLRVALGGLAAVLTLGLVAPPATAVNAGTTEGCTPGYWKVPQHHDSWQEARPTSPLITRFSAAAAYSNISDMTMVQALGGGGGSGADGAARILARAAVAAWLNAAYDDPAGGEAMQYPWRRAADGKEGRPPLVTTVNSALASGDRATMLELAGWLDRDNNLGCPLN